MMRSTVPCWLTGQPPYRMAFHQVNYLWGIACKHNCLSTQRICTLMYSPKSTRQWKWKKDRIQWRLNQQLSFNKWHRAVELPDDHVLVRDQDQHGLILGKTEQSRSYFVDTNKGTLRRNCSALVVTTKHPATKHSTEDLPSGTTTAPNSTCTFTNSTITAVTADKTKTNGRRSDGDYHMAHVQIP